jgi:Family of unknown function (DUF6247)
VGDRPTPAQVVNEIVRVACLDRALCDARSPAFQLWLTGRQHGYFYTVAHYDPVFVSPHQSRGANDDVVTVHVQGLAKTPAAIRDVLDPPQRQRFEVEYRAALARAADTLDLEPVLTLVQRTP